MLLGSSIFTIGFLQCRPLNYTWDKSIPGGVCMDIELVLYGTGIPVLLLNAVVAGMPMPVVWRLQMKWVQKVALLGTFGFGGL